jgi:hypothetical protein
MYGKAMAITTNAATVQKMTLYAFLTCGTAQTSPGLQARTGRKMRRYAKKSASSPTLMNIGR